VSAGHVGLQRVVDLAAQLRERALHVVDRAAALVDHEVGAAPRVERLEHAHVVAAVEQVGHDAAQEVRVAVVPVAHQRVAQDDYPHRADHRQRRVAEVAAGGALGAEVSACAAAAAGRPVAQRLRQRSGDAPSAT
jgi:hypothetical protein